jgi:hypothetical protein
MGLLKQTSISYAQRRQVLLWVRIKLKTRNNDFHGNATPPRTSTWNQSVSQKGDVTDPNLNSVSSVHFQHSVLSLKISGLHPSRH